MANDSEGSNRSLLLSMLGAARSTLVALDRVGHIISILPSDRPFTGRDPRELGGKSFAAELKADFVRVYNDKGAWDELGYFVDAEGERAPYLVQRSKVPISHSRTCFQERSASCSPRRCRPMPPSKTCTSRP